MSLDRNNCSYISTFYKNIDLANTQITRSGGEEVLHDIGGQDGTEAFEDVGHSDNAREVLTCLEVGTLQKLVCCVMVSTLTILLFTTPFS